ncbi:MAG: hypothetical protein KDJ99_13405, partial [Candidatus Competibacteraceae bacterium]|nr:hypothetical protein [Candidatus Competibacteraceae bacterium]
MTEPLGLAALLKALRTAGLMVGYTEIARLQHIFALYSRDKGADPQQAARQLRAMLRAVLVKNTEQSALFDNVYRAWLAQAEQACSARLAPALPVNHQPTPLAENTPAATEPDSRQHRYRLWTG